MGMSGDPRQRIKQLKARLKGEVPPVAPDGGGQRTAEEELPELPAQARLLAQASPEWQTVYEGVRKSVLGLRGGTGEQE
ncbi:hypothetical protein [Paenibacillus sp. 1P07SE]|uniref:hypothetical protein n=1 Tax=Paenibacillus sp. 1P07SE TaxID=3132209 RepID=UPI0039A69C45